MRRLLLLPLLAMPFLAGGALAQPGPIQVQQVWSRAAPQGRVGVLYMTITDQGAPDRLVGVDTPVAEKAELHESVAEGGVMKMRPVAAAPVEPGKPLVLKPGGYHVMLMGLRRTLKEGDEFPATIHFAHAGAVNVTAHVAKAGAAAPASAEMGRGSGAVSH
jgi:periplasmic copper chaperone A